jgi:hypothetical protein
MDVCPSSNSIRGLQSSPGPLTGGYYYPVLDTYPLREVIVEEDIPGVSQLWSLSLVQHDCTPVRSSALRMTLFN